MNDLSYMTEYCLYWRDRTLIWNIQKDKFLVKFFVAFKLKNVLNDQLNGLLWNLDMYIFVPERIYLRLVGTWKHDNTEASYGLMQSEFEFYVCLFV